MQRTLFQIEKEDKDITLVPSTWNAAEKKGIVSQMTFFAGARTHFSAVALSSSMPTLSFSYPTKAQGINRDIFGHIDFCLEPKYLDAAVSADHMSPMLNETAAIWLDLTERIPNVQREAQNAGIVIRQPLGEIE